MSGGWRPVKGYFGFEFNSVYPPLLFLIIVITEDHCQWIKVDLFYPPL